MKKILILLVLFICYSGNVQAEGDKTKYKLSKVTLPAQYEKVAVRIDKGKLETLNPGLLGINHNPTSYRFNLLDNKVVDLFKKIKPSYMRYLCGSAGKYFNYKKNDFYTLEELPEKLRDHPKIIRQVNKHRSVSKKRGLIYNEEKLRKFTKLVNPEGQLMKGANLFTAKSDDFMARFKQTIKNGETGRNWELGSEVYWGVWRLVYPKMSDYYKDTARMAKQMKKIDPTCKVGVSITHLPFDLQRYNYYETVSVDGAYDQQATYFKKERSGFDKEISPYLDDFDAIIVHPYCHLEGMDSFTKDDIIKYLLSYTDATVKTASKYYNELCPGKEVWVTEYNIMNMAIRKVEKGKRLKHVHVRKQLLQSLYIVDFVSSFMNYSDMYTVACLHDFSDPFGWGFLQDVYKNDELQKGKGFWILPQYYAYLILSDFIYSGKYSSQPEYDCYQFESIKEYSNDKYNSITLRTSFDKNKKPKKIIFVNKINAEQKLEFYHQGKKLALGKIKYIQSNDPVPYFGKDVEYFFDLHQELTLKEKKINKSMAIIPPFATGTIEIIK